ncbi:MAG: multiheme c-type cytochrome [Blastocatellia bacterium]
MLVDTGYFMADERNAHGKLRPDVRAKDDWVLKAYNEYRVDAINVSSHDLHYFAGATAIRTPESKPVLEGLISANTVTASRDSLSLRPFVMREIPSRQKGTKPVRVAFVGLTETTPAPPPGFKFTDPIEAARRTVPEARKKSDLVVVLAKVSSEDSARLAREVAGIDVIIAGNSISLEQAFTPPVYVGQTLIVYTPFEARMLGELRFYRTQQGKYSTKQRFIVLDELGVPEDAAAKQFVEGAARADSSARNESKSLLDNWLASSRTRVSSKSTEPESSRAAPLTYVTSGACSQCHAAQYITWINSGHAHATDPIPPRESEFEASCLDCHATGAKLATASTKFEMARLQGVQCEQCHGPGSAHVARPGKGYGRIVDLRTACTSCHTTETSPSFDFQTAWAKIKH